MAVGKLHTDRHIPLHPMLLELLHHWRDWAGPDDTGQLITNAGRPAPASPRIVVRCDRIVDRTVADHYYAASERVEALYKNQLM